MCIIAAKPAGVAMPSRETIRNMWEINRDGAGLMYVKDQHVVIEKGFMSLEKLEKKLDELERRLDLTATPVVMHFRITTHGGTKAENTHPFPITDNVNALGKPVYNTDLGVAHNGVIDITPRKGISDTMEYIASQLAPLKRAVPRFYKNKDLMLMVENATRSKLAFLTKDGEIITVGSFQECDGIKYSNDSYKGYHTRYGGFKFGSLSSHGWYDYADEYADDYRKLMFLWEGSFVCDASGKLSDDTWNYCIDADGKVYEYDFGADLAFRRPDLRAYNENNLAVAFEEDAAEWMLVCMDYTPFADKNPT